MKEVVAINEFGVKLYSGNLKLTKEQAMSRMHNLEPLGADVHKIKEGAEVCFKEGEPFFYDGVISKALMEELGTVERTEDAPDLDNTIDLDKCSKNELKVVMDEKEIAYTGRENKEVMIKMIMDHEAAQAESAGAEG